MAPNVLDTSLCTSASSFRHTNPPHIPNAGKQTAQEIQARSCNRDSSYLWTNRARRMSRQQKTAEKLPAQWNHCCSRRVRLIKLCTRESQGPILYAISLTCIRKESVPRRTNEGSKNRDTAYKLSDTRYQWHVPRMGRGVTQLHNLDAS